MDKFPKSIIKDISMMDDFDNRLNIFMNIDENQLRKLRKEITDAIHVACCYPIIVKVESYGIRQVIEVMKELYEYGWKRTFIVHDLRRIGHIGYPEWLYIMK